jgi:DNA polymerase III subunit gamma/tau
VPVTVLSRCQRFDLKRITAETLTHQFAGILEKEGVAAEVEALELIAQAAEGSSRDGLSILDQAIAHADMEGDGRISASQVRAMLGLSDRGAVRRLFALILGGDAQAVLAETRAQYQLGVEPAATLEGLLREVHRVTLAKLGSPHDATLPEDARVLIDEWSDQLSFPQLHRLWQLMLKGHEEVSSAAMPLETCDMAMLRVMHGASMPDPGELARLLAEGGMPPAAVNAAPNAPAMPSAPATVQALPADFVQMIRMLDTSGFVSLAATLQDVVRLVSYAPLHIAYQLGGPVGPGFAGDWADALFKLTGQRWQLEMGEGEAAPSLLEAERAAIEAERQAVLNSPLVRAAFEAFPEAELLDIEILPNQRSASA